MLLDFKNHCLINVFFSKEGAVQGLHGVNIYNTYILDFHLTGTQEYIYTLTKTPLKME